MKKARESAAISCADSETGGPEGIMKAVGFEDIVDVVETTDVDDLKSLSVRLGRGAKYLQTLFYYNGNLEKKVRDWIKARCAELQGSGEKINAARLKGVLDAIGHEHREVDGLMRSHGLGRGPAVIKRRGRSGKRETYETIVAAMDASKETNLAKLAEKMGRSGYYFGYLFNTDKVLEARVKNEIERREGGVQVQEKKTAEAAAKRTCAAIVRVINGMESRMDYTLISKKMGKPACFVKKFLEQHPQHKEEVDGKIVKRKRELLEEGKVFGFEFDSILAAVKNIAEPQECTHAGLSRAFGKEASYVSKSIERRPNLRLVVEVALEARRLQLVREKTALAEEMGEKLEIHRKIRMQSVARGNGADVHCTPRVEKIKV